MNFESRLKNESSLLSSRPEILDLGLVDYTQALEKQLSLVEEVSSDLDHHGYIMFCSHPAVVTTGRQTRPEDVFNFKGPIIEVSRGGRATYHGPSQLVVYPILNLKKSRAGRGPQEIRGYLRDFEKAIVETLAEYGVSATGKTSQKLADANAESEETGVWVGSKKIASLGIAVKKWVCYHGAAINLDDDATAFEGLNPCGFQASTMISLEKLIGRPITRTAFQNLLMRKLIDSL